MKRWLYLTFLFALASTSFLSAQIGIVDCRCVPVSSVSISNITTTSATVTWVPTFNQSRNCIFVIDIQNLSNPSASVSLQVSGTTTYNMPNLAPGNNYKVSVYINNNTSGCVGRPVDASFTTLSSTYCSSSSTTTHSYLTLQYLRLNNGYIGMSPSWITPNGSISAPSTGSPYVFIATPVNVPKNTVITNDFGIYYQAHTNTIPPYILYLNIWIDFDNNGVFDSYERVSSGSLTSSSSTPPNTMGGGVSYASAGQIQSIAIPNMTASNVRARMTLSVNQNVGPCSSFAEGQVVDFKINIIP
ncbi:hypothetical protein DBR32_10660 [Taibaiella sp. KBW10]|uniref:fibronectin type III domain-containing protein n=1 Tax=Taibaiella sp. KBW10 TaxID=2153357 RepID=UPI000F5A878B|nr:fibronectin type III domain-containing protein [Taibaiella sp. KBW10]RQO30045.1 hypothetical protein DBR32_10660 [Taibaiella sp. KBW10]